MTNARIPPPPVDPIEEPIVEITGPQGAVAARINKSGTAAKVAPPPVAPAEEPEPEPTGVAGAVGTKIGESGTTAQIPPPPEDTSAEDAIQELRAYAKEAIRRGAKPDKVAKEFKRLSGVEYSA